MFSLIIFFDEFRLLEAALGRIIYFDSSSNIFLTFLLYIKLISLCFILKNIFLFLQRNIKGIKCLIICSFHWQNAAKQIDNIYM